MLKKEGTRSWSSLFIKKRRELSEQEDQLMRAAQEWAVHIRSKMDDVDPSHPDLAYSRRKRRRVLAMVVGEETIEGLPPMFKKDNDNWLIRCKPARHTISKAA